MNQNGKINLRYHKCNKGKGNFGDELSPIIVNAISGREIINSGCSDNVSIIAIGSYIQMAHDGDIIWGSGIRNIDQICNYKNLSVRAVRGPITRKYLETKSITVPKIYGDPALLVPKLFDVNQDTRTHNKISFIPHYTSLDKYTDLLERNKYDIELISPLDDPFSIISKIIGSKFVISSSLHGIILADAYGIPNYWLYDNQLNEGTLKFEDYFASQNRQLKMHNNLENIFKCGQEEFGNKINLNRLLMAFPKELILK